ncbi:MAG: VanZ family protein [Clostridia bacterium]|nr:VanZ family protein [Clostridia bacterium]
MKSHPWKAVNTVVWILWLVIVIRVTLVGRVPQEIPEIPSLMPFAQLSIYLSGANREIIRSAFMNGVLFVPHGLLLSQIHTGRGTLFLTGITGMLISTVIEMLQWMTATGLMETDDVIANTLGALAGGWIGLLIRKYAENKT